MEKGTLEFLLLLLIFCASVQAQDVTNGTVGMMPPTNTESFTVFERPEEVHLPEGNYTNRVFTWDDSDTNIDHYNFLVSSSINPYRWVFVGSSTNRQFTLWLTNGLQIPAVQAVNKEGFVSRLCLWTNYER
jgi:hypothetical protein